MTDSEADADRVPFEPDWVVAPGELLADWMEDVHMTHETACQRLGVEGDWFRRFLKGDEQVTEDLSQKLSDLVGNSRFYWLNLESHYRSEKKRLGMK
jgi:HTH-type transcriptional regulator/antitoxin HigA